MIEALGFDAIDGYGRLGDNPFVEGSFEIVVANEEGTITNIVEVPISADPSIDGGVLSLQGIIDSINEAAGKERRAGHRIHRSR